jgi:NarL family two-component system response regulator LiaR
MLKTIRVLIADDHTIVRKGVKAVIGNKPDMEVVGEARNGEEAVAQVRSLKPDVVLMDLVMPVKTGVDAIREIKQADAQARILVLTSFGDDDLVWSAVQAGARGYLLKDSSPHELIEAIRSVFRGESSIDPAVVQTLIFKAGQNESGRPPMVQLTEREIQVLKLIAQGKSNESISRELVIGEGTVRGHVSNILEKLHLESRTQAALYALHKGLVHLNRND